MYKYTYQFKIYLVSILSILSITTISFLFPNSYEITNPSQQSDTIQTWTSWKLSSDNVLKINIVNPNIVSQDKISAIMDAILSENKLKINDPQMSRGSELTFFKGWKGALESINSSKFYIPTKFAFVESSKDADIIINLTNSSSDDLFSAYTTPILKAHHVIKVQVIIYKASEYSADMLQGIVRHEFGHVLGIGHSTNSEDLMYYLSNTEYPYISACDIKAIQFLYDGNESSNFVCDK